MLGLMVKIKEENNMNRIDDVVASRNRRIKEIRESGGTLVITDNDVPAGMGYTQEWQDDFE